MMIFLKLQKRIQFQTRLAVRFSLSWVVCLALVSILAAGATSCESQADSKSRETAAKPKAPPKLVIDGVELEVEIVQDAETREHGLMRRESLPENRGMLFVFETTQVLSFWMRNTFIPLDIAYITEDGRVIDIQQMAPFDDTKSYISAEPALYALEVNAGWFEKNNIKIGSQVTF